VSARDSTENGDLHTFARRVSESDPEVENFAAQAMAEIGRLRNQLAFAQHLNADFETSATVTTAHAARQSALLIEQADQLASAQENLREITSLCDLADWSAQTAGVGERPVVLVEDVRRLLRENAAL
jgi:predicted ATPase